MKRHGFLTAATTAAATAATRPPLALAGTATPLTASSAPPRSIPVSGRAVQELAVFDRAMVGFLTRWNIPGGQCAVAKDGRLVYARGFGYVNSGPSVPEVSPTARFRIASSTKPMTAVTTLRLVDQGAIGLEQRAFDILAI